MEKERLEWIDGLRGVAVLMVVMYHSWQYRRVPLFPLYSPPRGPFTPVMQQLGHNGVSLFLVISGVCLSWPVWSRLQSGSARPFIASEFFARRCLRILPPYYAALILSVFVTLMLSPHARNMIPAFQSLPTLTSLLNHVFLVHNLTDDLFAINGPFWSLGLEWQWYWLFPLVLFLCFRYGWFVLPVTASLAVLWSPACHMLLSTHFHASSWYTAEPQPIVFSRLFEFAAGIFVARCIVEGKHIRPATACLLIAAGASTWQFLGPVHLQHLGAGVGFAGVVLLAWAWPPFRTLLSVRPLVRLGVVSYSVYLVHDPVVEATEWIVHPFIHSSTILITLAVASACIAGWAFHVAVERPTLSPTACRVMLPRLRRVLAFTDRMYSCVDVGRAGSRTRAPAPTRRLASGDA